MSNNHNTNELMLEMYLYETAQNIEQLEICILDSESSNRFTEGTVNEIFRIMHTIKGSSAMMQYNNISVLAHHMEDLFYYIRENKLYELDYSTLSNLILECIDFIMMELYKISTGETMGDNATDLIKSIEEFLEAIKENHTSLLEDEAFPISTICKQYYFLNSKANIFTQQNMFKATLFFEDGCEMENMRALAIVNNIREISSEVYFFPLDIMESKASIQIIREAGFQLYMKTDKSYEEIEDFFNDFLLIKDLSLVQLDNDEEFQWLMKLTQGVMQDKAFNLSKEKTKKKDEKIDKKVDVSAINQSIISVNVAKLDKLMNLVDKMVISETMVIQNPDLMGLELDNFYKAARQLHKITSEIQDTVMSIRMVSLSTTFRKMQRIVRDMSKKLDKNVQLVLKGEEMEVDKNIIEHISAPLMHLVRNAVDHGIEPEDEREAMGKSKVAKIVLEAKYVDNDVLIVVKDDGRGLDKKKILKRARENNLLSKPESEMTDDEIFNLILLPGFSTKDNVTEYSGRGVGMDVVSQNIEAIGGEMSIKSCEGVGTSFLIKIPFIRATIEGTNIQVGNSCYTIPPIAIKETFQTREDDLIEDKVGKKLVMMRG